MDALLFLMDFILHVDRHLAAFVAAYGPWVYALLFAIVFVETGLVVMPFLPGDSLLFVTGALAGAGLIDIQIVLPLLLVAAIAGDQTNYAIGARVGQRSGPGNTAGGSTAVPLSRRTAFMSATVASPSSSRASCPLFGPSHRLWPAWRP